MAKSKTTVSLVVWWMKCTAVCARGLCWQLSPGEVLQKRPRILGL